MTLLVALLILSCLGNGADDPAAADDDVAALIQQANSLDDIDQVGQTLATLLTDPSKLKAAFSKYSEMSSKTSYVLFGGNWGPQASVSWSEQGKWQQTLTVCISENPSMINAVIRAERYRTFLRSQSGVGVATIPTWTFFEVSPFVDDLVEYYLEYLKRAAIKKALPVKSLEGHILLTAEEVESNHVRDWQLLCGICGRLDLMKAEKSISWRDHVASLESWFHTNRPYLIWNKNSAAAQIDEARKAEGTPTPRSRRKILPLVPPWVEGE